MSEYNFLYDLPRVDFNQRGLHYLPRIQYGREHPRQFMECIFKDGIKGKPVLVWIHGGGWQDDNLTPSYRPEETLAELAESGFFIACIEYRLAQHASFPACITDCQKAVIYLKKHSTDFEIDPDRIGVWGESAGAHIAAMTALNFNKDPEAEVQAAVLWYCPSDLKIQMERKEEKDIVSSLLGCDAKENPELVEKASPITYVGNRKIPFLLIHGDADQLVAYEQSVKFSEMLCHTGTKATLITVPGQGHGFFQGQEYYEDVINFLKTTLQETLKNSEVSLQYEKTMD